MIFKRFQTWIKVFKLFIARIRLSILIEFCYIMFSFRGSKQEQIRSKWGFILANQYFLTLFFKMLFDNISYFFRGSKQEQIFRSKWGFRPSNPRWNHQRWLNLRKFFHFCSNLPQKRPKHYSEYLLYMWILDSA